MQIIKKDDYRKVAKNILKNKPTILGFSTWCISYPVSLLIAEEIKELSPHIPIIFGGPQASIISEKTLEVFSFIDLILRGESDHTFPLLVIELQKQKSDFSKIPGLVYRNNSGIIHQNKLDEPISNLDVLPFPAYDLIPKPKQLKLDVGRGCPFHCTYCSTNVFFSKNYRVKSPDRILDEMTSIYKKSNIKMFGFAHDMFTMNKKIVLDLCKKLIKLKKEKKISFEWSCSARIDCVTDEMLVQMKKAGCKAIFFGVESGSERIQKVIRKDLDATKTYEVADVCKKVGIDMRASFILGFPEETEEDIEKTLQIILELALKGIFTQISELSLLPGTLLFDKHKNQLVFNGNFSNFSKTICGYEELKLIKKYPEIFSSFYHLPVKSMSQPEMQILCSFINRANHFRNTLYLLSDLIMADIKKEKYILFQSFKNEYHTINSNDNYRNAISLFWIKIIENYIIKNKSRITDEFLNDIFIYEGLVAILKSVFTTWQIVNSQHSNPIISNSSIIKPTPIWKILTTGFELGKILPSENKWNKNIKKISRRNHNYLLIAVSEGECKRIRINTKEIFLLENLSELSFQNYVKRINSVLSEREILLWIKKIKRLGVIEITEQQT